jgi:glycine cleavage system H protein
MAKQRQGDLRNPASMEYIAVLPCSGLDKEAGSISRELAMMLEDGGASLICPVLYQGSPKRYERALEDRDLLVIDGCKTGCASKLAKERGLKIYRKAVITELLRNEGLKSAGSPRIEAAKLNIMPDLAQKLIEIAVAERTETGPLREGELFAAAVKLREFSMGKFIFKVPEAGYFFNENDCWARVEGTRARLGVSDYVQQSASDMVFFEPPDVGKEIDIFDEAGSLESTKTALDIISPVSGKVVAVNEKLVEAPELVNLDPYVEGWAVELELRDFDEDRKLLMDSGKYFDYLKIKAEKEHSSLYGG